MHNHESPDFGLNDPELVAFEARLALLAPQLQIDRDRLMFAAGRRAASKRLRLVNRMLTAACVAFALIGAGTVLSRMTESPPASPTINLASPSVDRTLRETPQSNQLAAADDENRSVALAEGPTNQRLLRLWQENGESFDHLGDDEFSDGAVPTVDADATPPSSSRELLLRYLQSTSERL